MGKYSRSKANRLLGLTLILLACACAPATKEEPSKPKLSYVEALAIHNQELAALDRLKAQRQGLQQQLSAPSLEGVAGILDSAQQLQGELHSTLDELNLSQAPSDDPSKGAGAEGANRPAEEAADPLEQLRTNLQTAKEQQANQKDEIEKQIADLDRQIAEQQIRVDRADADRKVVEASR